MLYLWLEQFADQGGVFNLVRYLTFRTGAAILTALFICFVMGDPLIKWLRSKQKKGQPIRQDGPASHIVSKAGTPTMGGFLILLGLGGAVFLWGDLTSRYIQAIMIVTLSFGAIGFVDDYLKVTKTSPKGVNGKTKFLIEAAIAVLVAIWFGDSAGMSIALPFTKAYALDIGLFYIPFVAFVIVGASNAVNLTDGLDGLAIVPVIIAVGAFGFISYMVSNTVYSEYLGILHVAGTGELAVFAGAMIGAGLGFLWFNAPPAKVFMGDTGSLALGGAVGTMAVATKHEIVLGIIGGLFVLETVSVIVQVASFKLTGKRVFRMAPLHHHFEQKGWAESTIVIRFWIIAVVLALVGLATLKLR